MRSFCSVWDPMGNVKFSQLFFLYMEKLVWRASFNPLEYGPGVFNVFSLVGTQYPHFWRQGENIRSSKISPLWYSVYLSSYLGVYELYFFIWSFSLYFLWFLIIFSVSCIVCSPSWTWCSIFQWKSFYLSKKKKRKKKKKKKGNFLKESVNWARWFHVRVSWLLAKWWL